MIQLLRTYALILPIFIIPESLNIVHLSLVRICSYLDNGNRLKSSAYLPHPHTTILSSLTLPLRKAASADFGL